MRGGEGRKTRPPPPQALPFALSQAGGCHRVGLRDSVYQKYSPTGFSEKPEAPASTNPVL